MIKIKKTLQKDGNNGFAEKIERIKQKRSKWYRTEKEDSRILVFLQPGTSISFDCISSINLGVMENTEPTLGSFLFGFAYLKLMSRYSFLESNCFAVLIT